MDNYYKMCLTRKEDCDKISRSDGMLNALQGVRTAAGGLDSRMDVRYHGPDKIFLIWFFCVREEAYASSEPLFLFLVTGEKKWIY